jgi:hypothetical protein
MQFKVKWRGFDNPSEPYKNLRDNTYLHKYLFNNNMKGMIPKQHRNRAGVY